MPSAAGKVGDCFVCRKQLGEIAIPGGAIYKDELVYAGHVQILEGNSTAYLGYLMVEPQRHIPGLGDLNDEEAQALGRLVARLSRALKSTERAEHVYAFVLGHHVPHLHIHLVPRYPGAPRKYWGVHVDEWPEAPRGGSGEIKAMCGRLRAYLGKEG
ncbi:MAG: HIT family protein [Chloroflexi bacterium]|nr:HIT family protein [Chloroflexota bacterium]